MSDCSAKFTVCSDIEQGGSFVTGRMLTAGQICSHNTYEKPEEVKPSDFSEATLKMITVLADIPAKSIVVLEIE